MGKYRIVLLIIAILSAGCISASIPSFPSENEEGRIQKLLVNTWSGYIKDTVWHRVAKRDVTLQIVGVRKNQNGSWTVSAFLNWQSPEYIKLYVHNDTVELEMMSRGGCLYVLKLFGGTHLLGRLGCDRGKWPTFTQNEVILEKIPH